jgi:hypothetical protein
MKWALHLSTEEHEALERLNPSTLGHDDAKLRANYWKQFIESPESNVFKVQKI